MHCFLHIGQGKTGTSSIQKFLSSNKDTLEQYGFLFTSAAGSKHNSGISVASYMGLRKNVHETRRNIYSAEDLRDFRTSLIQSLRKEINHSEAKNIVFSSELLFSGLNIDEILYLKDLLINLGIDSVDIIVYLRDQVDHASSRYCQQVRQGATHLDPSHPSKLHHVYDYFSILQRWSNVFGREKMNIRIYDKEKFEDGSVVKDFISLCQMPDRFKHLIPNNVNITYSNLAIEVLRRVNRLLLGHKNVYEKRRFINDIISRLPGPKYLAPLHIRQLYRSEFKESNIHLMNTWFPQCKNLFNTPLEASSSLAINEQELDAISDIIAQLLGHVFNQDAPLDSLRMEIDKLNLPNL